MREIVVLAIVIDSVFYVHFAQANLFVISSIRQLPLQFDHHHYFTTVLELAQNFAVLESASVTIAAAATVAAAVAAFAVSVP
jgi:hypothetical protein